MKETSEADTTFITLHLCRTYVTHLFPKTNAVGCDADE